MKTKKIIALLVVVAFIPGCANIHNPLPPDAPEIPLPPQRLGEREECLEMFPPSNPVPYSLSSTKWKLVGDVTIETGELKVLEPADCEECHTLVFNTDTAAVVFGRFGTPVAFGNTDNFFFYTDVIHRMPCATVAYTEMWDGPREHIQYLSCIIGAVSYTITTTEMKLFYYYSPDDKKHYLLFKRIES
jgi:hypothetical protein